VPTAVEAILVAVLIIASAIWIGGYVAVIVVSFVSSKTLDGRARVDFFRGLGRAYLKMTTPALLVAYAAGWILLARAPWTAGSTRMVIGSAVLLAVLIAGVIQARDLTRLRMRLPAEPQNEALVRAVRVRARAASLVRGLLGILTLGLIINVAVLLVGNG
jgi:hypothetical protein